MATKVAGHVDHISALLNAGKARGSHVVAALRDIEHEISALLERVTRLEAEKNSKESP